MADEWEDPMTDSYLRGEPQLWELQANEFGMGDFEFDEDALEHREEIQKQLTAQLRLRRQYVDELIPGLPDKIEKPDPNWLPYTSDILRTHENDKGYNEVLRLTQAGVGFNDAVNQVLGMAEEMNYSLPLQLDTGDRSMMYVNGTYVPSMTEAEWEAQQRALANFEDVDKFEDLTEEQLASIDYRPPINIDEDAFRTGASQYVQEFSKQARHQEERDAVVARYADHVAPRYAFNIEQVLEDGYRPYSENFQATDKSPANQYDDPKKEWAARVAASAAAKQNRSFSFDSLAADGIPGIDLDSIQANRRRDEEINKYASIPGVLESSYDGTPSSYSYPTVPIPGMDYGNDGPFQNEQERINKNSPGWTYSSPTPGNRPTRRGPIPEPVPSAPERRGRTTEQRRVDSAEAARWAGNTGAVKNKNYTNTFARDQAAAKRSNQANKESNDRIEAHYRRFVEAAREGATMMSKEQQYNKMLSEYLGTVYRGGA